MKQKILVIDDSIVNINALYLMLRETYQVFVAKNGKDGIQEARKNNLSLILLAIMMPDMDGFEVLEELKKDLMTKQIPVMFITSLTEEENEEKALRMGAVDYITKPLKPSVIKAKVRNHIELYEYRKRMEQIALLDGLTGIYNRRSYDQTVKEYYANAIAKKQMLSAAILDIDCFKEYNDNYGHLQGDQVLKEVAQACALVLPKVGGYLARYGGEEFVVLLAGYQQEEAMAVIEQMRKKVSALGIEHLYNRAVKIVTISAGGASILPKEGSERELISQADKRLYRAKSLGRNRTVWEDSKEDKGQMEVFLFGRMKLLAMGGEVANLSGRKLRIGLFLAYLIMHRYEEYSKEDLVHAIWPLHEVEDPAYELKQLLKEVRNELSILKMGDIRDLVVIRDGTYHWNNSYLCIVDVELFENLYQEAMRQEEEERQYECCQHAVSLYKEKFLVKITNVDWIETLRSSFEKKYIEMILCLLRICNKRGDYERIVQLCQRQLYETEFHEEVHWYYMKALCALGHSEYALNHYEYMEETYYSAMRIEPSEKMNSLYLELIGADKEDNILNFCENVFREKAIISGAYYCDLHVFKHLYQLYARRKQDGSTYYLCMLGIKKDRYIEQKQLALAMQRLYQSIQHTLGIEDVFSKAVKDHYVILLSRENEHVVKTEMESIIQRFHEFVMEDKIQIETEVSAIKGADALQSSLPV